MLSSRSVVKERRRYEVQVPPYSVVGIVGKDCVRAFASVSVGLQY